MQNIATDGNAGRETVTANILEEEGTCLKFMTGSFGSYNTLFLTIV
jgi:hypothetical protein